MKQAAVIFGTLALGIIAGVTSCESDAKKSGASDEPAIYNQDNRLDWYQVSSNPQLQQAARSTLIMIDRSTLSSSGLTVGQNQSFQLPSQTFGTRFQLCPSEAFRTQPSVGSCSAFLIGPDTIATAGHCIKSQTDCETKAFVLDFMYDSASSNPLSSKMDKVFSCKTLLGRSQVVTGADYAILKLDRPVVGRQPLVLNNQNNLSVGTAIAMIGYPSGIPLKIAAGASVRNSSDINFFVTDLDAFGGNSGSAVVNLSTGLVEGILVRGVTDFVDQNGCKVAKVCTGNSCTGEEVTKSAIVAAAIAGTANQSSGTGSGTQSGSSGTNGTGSNGGTGANGTVANNPSTGTNPAVSSSGFRSSLTSLFRIANTRVRNCKLSLGVKGLEATQNPDEVLMSIDIKQTDSQAQETKEVTVNTKTASSALISILGSVARTTLTRCFLN